MPNRTREAVHAIDKLLRELYRDEGIEPVVRRTGESRAYLMKRVENLKLKRAKSEKRRINRLLEKLRTKEEEIVSMKIESRADKAEIKRYRELFDERT